MMAELVPMKWRASMAAGLLCMLWWASPVAHAVDPAEVKERRGAESVKAAPPASLQGDKTPRPTSVAVKNSAADSSSTLPASTYDPFAVEHPVDTFEDLSFVDESRKRTLPMRVYLPHERSAAPVVLFSHGLGGSRAGSAYLGFHWAGRGYVAVFLQHPGSDESVWRDVPVRERLSKLQAAAGGPEFLDRVQDVSAVIAQLERWHAEPGHLLHGRLNLTAVGMSGHSFGAITTQAVSGQSFPAIAARLVGLQPHPRIKAAVLMSPSPPKVGTAESAFSKVTLPWLLMTGTHDGGPIGNITPESRLLVYPALPAGQKYELVLDQAEHSVFTERRLPGEQRDRNPKHHPAIVAISTAFWDAMLKSDEQAREWLNGDRVRSVLEPPDRWQTK
jgi:predicted dienelactone hydrolase